MESTARRIPRQRELEELDNNGTKDEAGLTTNEMLREVRNVLEDRSLSGLWGLVLLPRPFQANPGEIVMSSLV